VAPAEAEQPPPAVVARELYSLNVHDEHELLVGVLKVTEGEEVIDATTHFCAANGLTRATRDTLVGHLCGSAGEGNGVGKREGQRAEGVPPDLPCSRRKPRRMLFDFSVRDPGGGAPVFVHVWASDDSPLAAARAAASGACLKLPTCRAQQARAAEQRRRLEGEAARAAKAGILAQAFHAKAQVRADAADAKVVRLYSLAAGATSRDNPGNSEAGSEAGSEAAGLQALEQALELETAAREAEGARARAATAQVEAEAQAARAAAALAAVSGSNSLGGKAPVAFSIEAALVEEVTRRLSALQRASLLEECLYARLGLRPPGWVGPDDLNLEPGADQR